MAGRIGGRRRGRRRTEEGQKAECDKAPLPLPPRHMFVSQKTRPMVAACVFPDSVVVLFLISHAAMSVLCWPHWPFLLTLLLSLSRSRSLSLSLLSVLLPACFSHVSFPFSFFTWSVGLSAPVSVVPASASAASAYAAAVFRHLLPCLCISYSPSARYTSLTSRVECFPIRSSDKTTTCFLHVQ